MNATDSTGANRVTERDASVSSVASCSTVRDRLPRGSRLRLLHWHPKFGLLGGAETHAPDLDNGQPPAHSAEPVLPPSEHLALPIPFGSPYHRRPDGRALGHYIKARVI